MTHPFTDAAAEEFEMSSSTREAFYASDEAQSCESPFALCERTVRACIETARWAPISFRTDATVRMACEDGQKSVVKALESLLPKPDRAEEIISQLIDENEAMTRDFSNGFGDAVRRLISKGMLK